MSKTSLWRQKLDKDSLTGLQSPRNRLRSQSLQSRNIYDVLRIRCATMYCEMCYDVLRISKCRIFIIFLLSRNSTNEYYFTKRISQWKWLLSYHMNKIIIFSNLVSPARYVKYFNLIFLLAIYLFQILSFQINFREFKINCFGCFF